MTTALAGATAAKIGRLHDDLAALPGLVVAFSAGVDSTMLLHAAIAALSAERVLAVTAVSPSLPAAELGEAERLAERLGARWHAVPTAELDREGYARNGPDRCFHCKTELFAVIDAVLAGRGEAGWPVAYGAIADDLGDHRPGARAAAERGVLAPLQRAGMTKVEVREYSRLHGLPTADKPAAACLASRVPHGTAIDAELLGRIERAEAALKGLGLREVRVRHHGDVARIEVGAAELGAALAARERVVAGVRAAGYRFVALDLEGYRTGSLNPPL